MVEFIMPRIQIKFEKGTLFEHPTFLALIKALPHDVGIIKDVIHDQQQEYIIKYDYFQKGDYIYLSTEDYPIARIDDKENFIYKILMPMRSSSYGIRDSLCLKPYSNIKPVFEKELLKVVEDRLYNPLVDILKELHKDSPSQNKETIKDFLSVLSGVEPMKIHSDENSSDSYLLFFQNLLFIMMEEIGVNEYFYLNHSEDLVLHFLERLKKININRLFKSLEKTKLFTEKLKELETKENFFKAAKV